MSITPEQFSILTTKEEHKELSNKVDIVDEKLDKIMSMVDLIAKNSKIQDEERVTNMEAHDRINRDLFKVKENLNLESMEVVKQI